MRVLFQKPADYQIEYKLCSAFEDWIDYYSNELWKL